MGINITHLAGENAFKYSHSRAEGGDNASANTWRAALSGPRPILRTDEEREEARDWLQDSVRGAAPSLTLGAITSLMHWFFNLSRVKSDRPLNNPACVDVEKLQE